MPRPPLCPSCVFYVGYVITHAEQDSLQLEELA